MTNDMPPKACLADFGFITMVLDPRNPMSPSFTLEGGTMSFIAPELFAPSKYGLVGATPTQETDIYAFGSVIFQVLALDCHHLPLFLDIPPGSNWRTTVSGYQISGTRVPRLEWGSSG